MTTRELTFDEMFMAIDKEIYQRIMNKSKRIYTSAVIKGMIVLYRTNNIDYAVVVEKIDVMNQKIMFSNVWSSSEFQHMRKVYHTRSLRSFYANSTNTHCISMSDFKSCFNDKFIREDKQEVGPPPTIKVVTNDFKENLLRLTSEQTGFIKTSYNALYTELNKRLTLIYEEEKVQTAILKETMKIQQENQEILLKFVESFGVKS